MARAGPGPADAIPADTSPQPVGSSRRRGVAGLVQWVFALGLTAASLGFVISFADGFWFTSDMWDFLVNREIGSAEDVFGARGANWVTPTVVTIRTLYGLFEMDFWPWYFLPRLIGYPLLCLWLWRVMLKRGADPVVALAGLGMLLFYGPSSFLQGAFMGHALAIALLMAVGLLVTSREPVTRRDRWLVFGMLVLMVMSNSPGVASFAGITIVLVVTGRIRQWWPPVVGAGAVYGVWVATYMGRDQSESVIVGYDELKEFPTLVLSILEGSLPRILAVSADYRFVLVFALLATLVWLAASGRLDAFDAMVLSTLGVYLGLVVVGRLLTGLAQATSARYAYMIGLFLIPVLVPKIRVPRAPVAYGVTVLVALAIGLGHVSDLQIGLEFWSEAGRQTKAQVETAAALIAEGEPRLDRTLFHRFARPLTGRGAERLLDDGWGPRPSDDPAVVESARGVLRIGFFRGGGASGEPLLVAGGVRADGCVVTPPGETLEGTVVRAGAVTVEGPAGPVVARWQDEFGVGTRTFEVSPRGARLSFPAPATTARLQIEPLETRLVTCGVAAGSG